jgi:release factor glutamine methyltransferase
LQNSSSDMGTYVPAEDTLFFAGFVQKESGTSALEIGTGSGYIAEILEKNFDLVVRTDIDFASLAGQSDTNCVCCDGASALREKFDLIVCNFPYLPSEQILDRATDGGPEGLQVPLHIMETAAPRLKAGGRMLLLTSSLANYEKLIREIESRQLSVSILGKKSLFFEDLVVLEARF